jgi:aminopeptidase N
MSNFKNQSNSQTLGRIILKQFIGGAVIVACLAACSQNAPRRPDNTKAAAGDTEAGLLTQTLAVERAELVSNVSYDLSVVLDEKSPQFRGTVIAEFNYLKQPDEKQNMWLDFRGGTIERLDINGARITQGKDGYSREGSLLWIPVKALKKGANRINVSYMQNYNTNGVGLHRFQDPEDNEVYLYTQFEPYDACRFFPLFDQPDLRATLKLKVRAPAKWHVITNTDPERVSTEGEQTNASATRAPTKYWNFKKTLPIASYLFALHAGPYKEFKSSHGRTPLRLFIRKSLAEHLPVEQWFTWTKQGLTYFEKYFGTPYAFGKYDQIVVPEFNMGAMENVAAITFSERYIKRGGMTQNEKLSLSSVILHEMAHQWFGNLVTMKWWDDLWLNESFATFMAAKAMYEGSGIKDAWIDFNSDKQWAQFEDQLVTTHPIAATVANTDQAFNNFDGITYGKGGAVIQQLEYLIGEKPFQMGLQHYFKTHAYKNTTLRDFIAALQTQSKVAGPKGEGQDLQAWSKLWLEQSGVDTLRAETQCAGKNLQSITLTITPSTGATFRPQAVEVSTLVLGANKMLRRDLSQKVFLKEPKQTVTFKVGAACPDLVYPNSGDYAYAKIPLTLKEIEILRDSLVRVEDTHLRLMLWTNLWQMVRDGSLATTDYADIVLKNAPGEADMKIYEFALGSLVGGRHNKYNNALYFIPQDTESERAIYRGLVNRIEGWLIEALNRNTPTSDKFKASLASLSVVAESERALNELYIRAQGDDLDLDRRWAITGTLCRSNHPKSLELKDKLLKLDSSSRGQNSALACDASTPNIANKKKMLAQVIGAAGSGSQKAPSDEVQSSVGSQLSGEKQKAIIRALVSESQERFLTELSPDIKIFIRNGLQKRDEDFQEDFAESLAPVTCDATSVSDFRKFVNNVPLSDVTTRAFKILLQERERCVLLRQKIAPGPRVALSLRDYFRVIKN